MSRIAHWAYICARTLKLGYWEVHAKCSFCLCCQKMTQIGGLLLSAFVDVNAVATLSLHTVADLFKPTWQTCGNISGKHIFWDCPQWFACAAPKCGVDIPAPKTSHCCDYCILTHLGGCPQYLGSLHMTNNMTHPPSASLLHKCCTQWTHPSYQLLVAVWVGH